MLWKVRLPPIIIHIFLCITSSFLLVLAFPNSNIELLAWLGLVPLFLVIGHTTLKGAFWFSCLTGVLFFSFIIYWLSHVTLFGLIVLVLYLSLYFGIFGGLVKFFWERSRYLPVPPYIRTLIVLFFPPVLWVTLEFIRTHLLTGFGWALLGYSQYLTLPVIQIADITGVYGVSFLIVLVNIGIYLMIRNFNIEILRLAPQNDKKKCHSDPECNEGEESNSIYLILPWIFLAASLIYGNFKLNEYPQGDRTLTVSVVQGNIPQDEKWAPEFRMLILEKYEVLTKLAAMEEPALIIWPETSFPGIIVLDEINQDILYQKVVSLAKDIKTPILIGSQRNDVLRDESFNSAILVSQDGNIKTYYDKLHLVPFGEYVPLGRFFPFIGKAIDVGDFAKGNEYTLFSLPQGKFGTLICFEDIFPGQVRQFVREGADFLVNITNDAWFGRTSAPYQHAQASVFRAIENRRYVVRSANTGLSCFINPRGEIKKMDIFTTGHKTETIRLNSKRSFYTTYGDLFAVLCIVISAIALLYNRKILKYSEV